MFDKILSLIHEDYGFTHFSSIVGAVEILIEKF